MARMHVAGRGLGLHRANDLSLDGWRDLVEATRDRADAVRPGLAGEIERELEELSRAWPRDLPRSEEHTSELQSLMRISYAVFCLKKKKTHKRATYPVNLITAINVDN